MAKDAKELHARRLGDIMAKLATVLPILSVSGPVRKEKLKLDAEAQFWRMSSASSS
jgi:hypothetical protein